MGETLVIWVIGFLALALIMVILELFVPSGGLLGVGAFLCGLAAMGLAFRVSSGFGMAILALVVVAVPTIMWMGLKIFPHTPIGRRIILSEGTTDEDLHRRESELSKETRAFSALVGARGKAITDLRPGGTARFDGQDIEAFAEAGMIHAGTEVEITSVSGRQIHVQAVAK